MSHLISLRCLVQRDEIEEGTQKLSDYIIAYTSYQKLVDKESKTYEEAMEIEKR